jgi:hypothetical protein
MTTWNRIACFYIDVDAFGSAPLLAGKNSSLLNVTPVFIQSDKFPLQLYFRKRSATTGGASAAVEQDPTDNIIFACKETSELTGTTLLFSAVGFVKVGTGDDVCYQATLNLHTPELIAAMSSVSAPLPVTIDIEVQNSDNTERTTFQFTALVKKQAYAGESNPVPAAPHYPAPSQLVLKHADGASLVFVGKEQHPYLYCSHCGLYFPYVIEYKNGGHALGIGDGVTL